jgi:bifunctional DNA-binding transcriptional regulator/antitoxin component of YhaV-PrlF toxin-antitoxin module
MAFMKPTSVTRGGQISLPAEIRRRWGTKRVSVEDHGDYAVVRPVPDDPIAAAHGALRGLLDVPKGMSVAEWLEAEKRREIAEDEAKQRRDHPGLFG